MWRLGNHSRPPQTFWSCSGAVPLDPSTAEKNGYGGHFFVRVLSVYRTKSGSQRLVEPFFLSEDRVGQRRRDVRLEVREGKVTIIVYHGCRRNGEKVCFCWDSRQPSDVRIHLRDSYGATTASASLFVVSANMWHLWSTVGLDQMRHATMRRSPCYCA